MLSRSTRQLALVMCALCALLIGASVHAQTAATASASATTAPAEAPAADASASTSDAAAAVTPAAETDWALEHRRYATRNGGTGGLYVNDPGGGEPGAVRFQLFFDVRPTDDFLSPDLETSQNRQTLAVSWTALRALEVYGSLYGQGTSIGGATPSTVHVNGGQLGFKVFTHMAGPWQVGGGMRFELIDSLDDDTPLFKASSLGLDANASLDLRRTSSRLPLVSRLSAEYFFDNRGKIMESTEKARYATIQDPLPADSDDRHLLTRAERFALGVNRVDMLNVGLGFEVPLQVATDTFLHPLLEYRVGLPVNRQGYDCPTFVNRQDAGTPESDTDECLAIAGAQAWPMNLTIGLRFVPPVRGLSVAVALDLGLTGTSMFVHELSPNAPFTLGVALGYDYDARPAPALPAASPPAPAPAPAEGRVRGLVSDAQSGQPLADVIVTVVGLELGPVATDAAGEFTTYLLPPGPVKVELRRVGYEPGQCEATIAAAGGEVRAACVLTASVMSAPEAAVTEPAAGEAVPTAAGAATGTEAMPAPTTTGAPAQPTAAPPQP